MDELREKVARAITDHVRHYKSYRRDATHGKYGVYHFSGVTEATDAILALIQEGWRIVPDFGAMRFSEREVYAEQVREQVVWTLPDGVRIDPIWAVLLAQAKVSQRRPHTSALRPRRRTVAGDVKMTPVLLEQSVGTNFVWLVWAVNPETVRLIAVCSDEKTADCYATSLPPGLEGFRAWKERAPIDHSFGFADSMHARVLGKIGGDHG